LNLNGVLLHSTVLPVRFADFFSRKKEKPLNFKRNQVVLVEISGIGYILPCAALGQN
jgi:hypothetical protein